MSNTEKPEASAAAQSVILPKPFWPESTTPSGANYKPVDTITESTKIALISGLFLGGMHFRRLLQHRKGSARPSHARYLALFELNKRHFVSIPLALGTYSFVSNSLMNLNEERLAKNEALAMSSGILVATIFKKSMPLNAKIGIALGLGVAAGIFNWAGGFILYDSGHSYQKATGQINDQVSNKSLDEDFATGTYKKQGFWEVVYRKPLSQTAEELGEGRGIVRA